MSLWLAIVLGALQGLTEFLPVSSSGHLVVFGDLLIGNPPPRSYDVAVHVGTLAAVIVYYRQDIGPLLRGLGRLAVSLSGAKALRRVFGEDDWARLAALLVIGCLPTAVIGVALDALFEGLFASALLAAVALFVTAAVLVATDLRLRHREGAAEVGGTGAPHALLIGIAQGVAIVPGISRSGAVLCAGVWCGLSREFALRFGFLLSIPAILGAAAYEILGGLQDGLAVEAGVGPAAHFAGAIVAAGFGYLAIAWLLRATRRGRLWMFGVYCVLAGIVGLAVALT